MIDKAGDIDSLLASLRVVLEDGDLERLGVVMDADTSVGSRWDALRNIFTEFGGRDLPRAPDPQGTIIILEQPYRVLPVGVWIMPDNQIPGILENFVGFLVPDDDRSLWQRARDCVAGIPEEQRHFSEAATPKAEIHTWLAWQEEPGQPLGTALTARYLDADAPHALQLVNWVRRLFHVLG